MNDAAQLESSRQFYGPILLAVPKHCPLLAAGPSPSAQKIMQIKHQHGLKVLAALAQLDLNQLVITVGV